MAYNTKVIKVDGSTPKANPIPQYYNPTTDEYEPALGRNGAPRTELYGSDGNPISVSNGKLAVRASEIETALAGILAKIIAAPATEAKQDTLIGYVDGVETALTALQGYVDGIEGALTTLNAKDFATQTTLASILTQLGTTGLKKIIDALPAGTNLIGKVGIDQTTNGVALSGSNTRKYVSDTITIGTGAAHSAGDVVSTNAGEILEFDTGLPAGSGGMILSSLVTLSQNAVFSGGAGYVLHLFTTSPTAQATNAVFNLNSLAGYIGSINISTLVDLGDNCASLDTGHNLDFTLAGGDTKIYGKLVCVGAETTVTDKVIAVNLGIAAL